MLELIYRLHYCFPLNVVRTSSDISIASAAGDWSPPAAVECVKCINELLWVIILVSKDSNQVLEGLEKQPRLILCCHQIQRPPSLGRVRGESGPQILK